MKESGGIGVHLKIFMSILVFWYFFQNEESLRVTNKTYVTSSPSSLTEFMNHVHVDRVYELCPCGQSWCMTSSPSSLTYFMNFVHTDRVDEIYPCGQSSWTLSLYELSSLPLKARFARLHKLGLQLLQ